MVNMYIINIMNIINDQHIYFFNTFFISRISIQVQIQLHPHNTVITENNSYNSTL